MALFLFSIFYPKIFKFDCLKKLFYDSQNDPIETHHPPNKPKEECYRFHASFVKRIERPKKEIEELKQTTIFPKKFNSSTESEYFSASEEFYCENGNFDTFRNEIETLNQPINNRNYSSYVGYYFQKTLSGQEILKIVVNEFLSVYTQLWFEHPEMALVGTQLAIMACVLCKSDCCKCCCVSVDKKKKKTLKSIKAASAADIYMAPTPEGRRYLPKKSRKPPDPSVIKVNKANAREWRSQEKLWMEKKTGSQGSLHSGYATTPYKYRYFAGKSTNIQSSTQSLFVVSTSAPNEPTQEPTLHTSESNLLKLSTSLTDGPQVHYVEVYDIPDETDKQKGTLDSTPAVPRTSSSPPSLRESIHEDVPQPSSSQTFARPDTEPCYRKGKIKRETRKTQSLTAVMDESGLYSKLVMSPRFSIPEYDLEPEEPMPEPILVMSTPPPSPIVTKKTKKYHDLGYRESVLKKMRRGFKQIFSPQREDDFENQPPAKQPYTQERRTSGGGFFQKIFKNPEETVGPVRVETEDGGYAEIRSRSNDRDGWDGRYWKKREMSVPVSPKTVKFEDEIERELAAESARQRATVSPTSLYSRPEKYRFQPIVQPPITSKSTVYPSGRMAPPPQGAATTETLDEATLDMLRMSVEPTGISFSGTARISPTADRLQKSASTSTMNKVIRTQDGGVLKLENAFTWDVDRRQNNSPDNHPRARSETRTTNQTNPDGTQSRTTETTHEESHHIAGKPVIRTTVEGQMKIEKSVGTRLETIEHSIAKAYTIRETVTHYLIRTTMGKREVIIEERPPSATMDETSTVRSGVRTSGIYRLSVYEDGQEIGRHEADIKIPDNMNKPDYLAKLSQKLLADLATLDGEEITATTRVEIERVEDVTDYVKTYLIGQALAEPEPEPAPIQLAIPTEPEKVYNYESASDALSSGGLTPNMELNSRSYVDKLEREPEATLEKKDIHLTTEGKLYEDKTRFGGFSPKIPMESDTESVESILVDRRLPRCANVYADCDLKRTEDRSENTVLIAMPLTISMTMILRIERIREKLQLQQAAYGMEREGQKFKGEAVMRKHRRFESEEEEQEEEKVKLQQAAYGLEREGQHFRDAAVMKKQKRYESEEEEEVQRVQEQAKIVQEEKEELQVIQIQETKKVEEIKVKQIEVKEATAQVDVTLFKKESYGNFDLTIETANYAQGVLVRTKAVKIETDAMGAAYDLESRGQLLKGKALIRKHRQFESESEESIQSEELEPPAAAYDFERGGQFLEGQALLRRHKKYESETSMDYEGEMRQRGGVTHVTLFKKEAEGYFDITIECPNWGPETKARLKEVPAQRYENLEFVKSIEKTGSTRIQEETKAVFKENNKWAATLNTVAQSSENVNFIMNLKKESDYQLFLAGDSSAEGYIRSPRMESTTKSITESAEENLMVMYGLEAATKNIASSEITRKEATVQKSAKQLMEYTKEEESCAVLMENRGTLAERAASGWMDTVTELRRSEEREEVEETSLISTVGYEADRGEWFDEELRKCRSVYTDFGREFSETITEESAQIMSDSQLEHTIRASRAGSSHGTTIIWIPPDEGETQLPPIGFQRRSYSIEKDVLSRSMTDISQKTSIELIEGTKPIEDTSLTSRESSSETSTSVSTEIETTQLRTIVESLGKISAEDNTTQQVKKAQKPSEKVQEASQKADMRAGIREISQPAEFSETNATLVQQQQLQEVTQTTTGLSFPRTEANLLLTQACKTLAAIEDITLVASASNVGATESTLVAANLEQVRRSAEEARMEMGSLLHSYEIVERDLRKDIVITESRQQEKVFKTKAPMEEALVYEQKFEVHPQEVAKVTKTSKTKISLEASKNLSIKEEAVDSEITKPATEVSASRDIGVTLSSQEKARLKEYGFETSEFGVGFQRVSKPPSLEETEAVLAEKLLLHNTIKTIATSFEQVGQNVHLAAETMREAAQRSLHIATTEKDFLKSTAAKTEEILVEMKAGAPSKTFEIKTTQKILRKDSEKAQLRETAIELGSIQQTYQYIETDLRHVLTLPEALLQQILLKVRAAAEETAQLEKQLSVSPIASSEVISKLKLTEQAARSLFVESQDVGAKFLKHDREFSTAKIMGIPDVTQDQARLKEYHAETSDVGTGFARLPKPSVDQEAEILLEERIKLQQGLNLLASIFEQVEYNIQMAAEAAREVAQKEVSMKTLEHGELISKAATSEVAFSESELNALRITSDVESTLKDRIRQSAQEKLRETSVEMGNVHQAYLFAETDLRQDITVPVGRSQKQKLETKASMEEKIAIESKIGVSPVGVSEITSKIKPAEEASRSLSIEKLEIHEGLTKPSVDVEISKTSGIPVSDQERAVLREYEIEASSLQAGFERISKPASYQEAEISTEDQLRLQQTLDMKASTFEKVEQNIQMVSQLAKETAEKGISIKPMEQGDLKAKAAEREEILVSTDFGAQEQEVGAKAEAKAPSREEIQAHHPEKADLTGRTKIEEVKEEARLREVSRLEEQYFIEKPVGVPSLDHEQAKFEEEIVQAQSEFEIISKPVDYEESERIQQIKLQDKLASTEVEQSIQLDSEQPKQVVLAHAEQVGLKSEAARIEETLIQQQPPTSFDVQKTSKDGIKLRETSGNLVQTYEFIETDLRASRSISEARIEAKELSAKSASQETITSQITMIPFGQDTEIERKLPSNQVGQVERGFGIAQESVEKRLSGQEHAGESAQKIPDKETLKATQDLFEYSQDEAEAKIALHRIPKPVLHTENETTFKIEAQLHETLSTRAITSETQEQDITLKQHEPTALKQLILGLKESASLTSESPSEELRSIDSALASDELSEISTGVFQTRSLSQIRSVLREPSISRSNLTQIYDIYEGEAVAGLTLADRARAGSELATEASRETMIQETQEMRAHSNLAYTEWAVDQVSSETSSRGFSIDRQSLDEVLMKKSYPSEVVEKTQKDIHVNKTGAQLCEFTSEEEQISGVISRIPRAAGSEEVDLSLPEQRFLKVGLETSSAKEEVISLGEEDQHKIQKSLQATEGVTATFEQLQPIQQAEALLTAKGTDSTYQKVATETSSTAEAFKQLEPIQQAEALLTAKKTDSTDRKVATETSSSLHQIEYYDSNLRTTIQLPKDIREKALLKSLAASEDSIALSTALSGKTETEIAQALRELSSISAAQRAFSVEEDRVVHEIRRRSDSGFRSSVLTEHTASEAEISTYETNKTSTSTVLERRPRPVEFEEVDTTLAKSVLLKETGRMSAASEETSSSQMDLLATRERPYTSSTVTIIPRTEAQFFGHAPEEELQNQEARFSHADITSRAETATITSSNLVQASSRARESSMESSGLLHSYDLIETDSRVSVQIPFSLKEETELSSLASTQETRELSEEIRRAEIFEMLDVARKLGLEEEVAKTFGIDEKTTLADLSKIPSDEMAHVIAKLFLEAKERRDFREYGRESSESSAVFIRTAKPAIYDETVRSTPEFRVLQEKLRTRAASVETMSRDIGLQGIQDEILEARLARNLPREEQARLASTAASNVTASSSAILSGKEDFQRAEGLMKSKSTSDASKKLREIEWVAANLIHSYDFIEADLAASSTFPQREIEKMRLRALAARLETAEFEDEVSSRYTTELTGYSIRETPIESTSREFSTDYQQVAPNLMKSESFASYTTTKPARPESRLTESVHEFGSTFSAAEIDIRRLPKPREESESIRKFPQHRDIQYSLTTKAASVDIMETEVDLWTPSKESSYTQETIWKQIPTTTQSLTSLPASEVFTQAETSLVLPPSNLQSSESLIKALHISDARAQLREIGSETANVIQNTEFVDVDTRAHTIFPQALVETVTISSVAPSMEVKEVYTDINRKEKGDETHFFSAIKSGEATSKDFSIEEKLLATQLTQLGPMEKSESKIQVARKIEAEEKAREFEFADSSTTAAMRRVVREAEYEESEITLQEKRELEQYLSTPAVTENLTQKEVSLGRPQDQDGKAALEKSIPLQEATGLTSKAAGDELKTSETSLTYQVPLEATSTTMKSVNLTEIETRLKEAALAEASSLLSHQFIETDARQQAYLPEQLVEKISLQAKSSAEEKLTIESEVLRAQETLEVRKTQQLTSQEANRAKFGIDEKRVNEGFVKESIKDELKKTIPDVTQEQTQAVLREFGVAETVTEAIWARETRPATFEESEISVSVQRSGQERLSTKAVSEVVAEKQLDLAAMVKPSLASETTKAIARAEGVTLTGKAAQEEYRLAESALEQKELVEKSETSLQTSTIEQAESKKFHEISDESKSLSKYMDIVENQAQVQKFLPELVHEQAYLTSSAVSETTVSISPIVESSRPDAGTTVQKSLRPEEVASRKFAVAPQVATATEIQRFADQEEARDVMAEVAVQKDERKVHEFGDEKIEVEGVWSRVVRPASEHYQDFVVSTERRLEDSFKTKAVTSEETVREARLEASRIEAQDATGVYPVYQKEQFEQVEETFGKEDLGIGRFFYGEQPKVKTQTSVETARMEEFRTSFRESSEDMQHLSSTIEVIETDLMTHKFIKDQETASETLRTTAAKTIDTTQEQLLTKKATQLAANQIQAEKEAISEERRFKIQQESTEKSISAEQKKFTSEKVVTETRIGEPTSSTRFTEIQRTDIDSAAYLCKITSSRRKSERAEFKVPIARVWREELRTKAAGVEDKIKEVIWSQPVEEGVSEQKIKEKTVEIIHYKTPATKEINIQVTEDLKTLGITSLESEEKTVKVDNKETAFDFFKESSAELNSLTSEWRTVLNELEFELVETDKVLEKAALSTKAVSDSTITTSTLIEQPTFSSTKDIIMNLTNSEEEERKFTVEVAEIAKQFAKSGTTSDIRQKVAEVRTLPGSTVDLIESAREDLNAGVLLVRMPLKKKDLSAAHIVDVSANVAQVLTTQHASDIETSSSVTWTGKEPLAVADYTLQERRNEKSGFHGAYAKDIATEKKIDLSKKDSVTLTEKILAAARVESGQEKFTEISEEGAIEISQWTTVIRDAEASAQLAHRLNLHQRLSTLEASEETTSVNEQWQSGEEKVVVQISKPEEIQDAALRSFKIEETSQDLDSTRPTSHEDRTEISTKIPKSDQFSFNVKESGDAKLHATINLHRVEVPAKTAAQNEFCVSDISRISAPPLQVSSTDVASAYYDQHLQKPMTSAQAEKLLKAKNWGQPIAYEAEESTEEKTKLAIDLQGKVHVAERVMQIVKIPNKADGVKLSADEFEEDEALLYAQINSRETKHLDQHHVVGIPRKHEPIGLKTNASREEKQVVNEQWEIAEGKEFREKTFWVPRRGQDLDIALQESKQRSIQVGFVYERESPWLEISKTNIDSRNGGNYSLNTLAAGREDRHLSMNLSRKLQAEIIRGKFKHRTKSELSIHLLESTQENMSTNYNFQKAVSYESVFSQQICPNTYEPIIKKCLESTYVSDTVNYEYKTPESREIVGKIQGIANFGGGVKLKTDAAEDIRLNVERELKKDEEFAVLEKLVIDKNSAPPQTLAAFEPTSESYVANDAYNREEEEASADLKIIDKNRGQDVLVNLKEAREITQTSYVEFKQKEDKATLDKTIIEPRQGGFLRLTTTAAELEDITCIREISADRVEVLHVDRTFIIPNEASPVQLDSPSTTQTERYLQSALQKSPEHERITHVARARTTLTSAMHVTESLAEECTVHCDYKRDESLEISENVVQIPNAGGRIEMSTKASGDLQWKNEFSLEKRRDTELKAVTKLKTFNTIAPVALRAKESTWQEASIGEQWVKEQAQQATGIVRIIGNVGSPATLTIRESTAIEEFSNLQWSRPDARESSTKTLLEARFGGSFYLHTGHAREETVELRDNHLTANVISEGEAQLIRKTPNLAAPVSCSTRASTSKEIIHSANLFKPEATEKLTHVRKSANEDRAQHRVRESEAHFETTNAQFRRLDEVLDSFLTVHIPRFGGSTSLATSHAKDRSVTIPVDLRVDAPSFLNADITLNIPRTPDLAPFLRTGHTTEISTTTQQELLRKSDVEEVGKILFEPYKGAPTSLQIRESKSVEETINCQWARETANLDFTEIRHEARFGGSVALTGQAAGDEAVLLDRNLDQGGARELETGITIVEKRQIPPEQLNTYAMKVSDANIVSSLQRSEEREATSFKKDVPRTIENPSVKVTETSEIEQINNVQLKRSEATERSETLLNESRYGGAVHLSTKHAGTAEIESEKILTLSESVESADLKIKTANLGEPVLKSCGHSTQEDLQTSWSLESSKVFQGQTTIVLSSPNKSEPTQLKSGETEQVSTTTNVAIQNKLLSEAEKEVTLPMPKFGGGYTIHTSAAKQEQGGEVAVTLFRTQETFDASHTSKTTAEGIPVKAIFKAAEETIFNTEVTYQKQPEEMAFHWTGPEVRKESGVSMQSSATKAESIEVTETEVRRRLTEVEVEGVIARSARETSPIVLNTEYAAETIIRMDQILESDARRHRGELEKEVAIARTEIVEEFQTEDAEKIRLRRGYYNAAEEREKEEMEEDEKVRLRRGYYNSAEERERERESKEKRVSFAADVTEKTMDLDLEMSMSVEERNKPSIIKKPMKKERERRRRDDLRKNEAPSFAPVRRNSLLMALNIGSPHNLPRFKTLEDIIRAIKEAGLEYSNLIFGIDYTRSNFYQGERTFDCKSLHHIGGDEPNPYQAVIEIVGKTLSSFDADGLIPAYGFGDEECTDQAIFNLIDRDDSDACCEGFQEVLRIYNQVTPSIQMSGPTNFVPLIEKAVDICREKHSYHILVIVADGQVTNEKINQRAIAAASHYPLSIIMVGVGDGPWDMMTRFDETLPKRIFDNFHFVDFHKVMFNAPNPEASFALNALMEIPDQYKAIKELGLLKPSRRG